MATPSGNECSGNVDIPKDSTGRQETDQHASDAAATGQPPVDSDGDLGNSSDDEVEESLRPSVPLVRGRKRNRVGDGVDDRVDAESDEEDEAEVRRIREAAETATDYDAYGDDSLGQAGVDDVRIAASAAAEAAAMESWVERAPQQEEGVAWRGEGATLHGKHNAALHALAHKIDPPEGFEAASPNAGDGEERASVSATSSSSESSSSSSSSESSSSESDEDDGLGGYDYDEEGEEDAAATSDNKVLPVAGPRTKNEIMVRVRALLQTLCVHYLNGCIPCVPFPSRSCNDSRGSCLHRK